jgi:FkbM family methyltransferase
MQFGFKAQYMDYVEKIQSRKLVLFGAGMDAAPIISKYYRYDDIYSIWDNNPSKWGGGKKIAGITVSEPHTDMPESIVVIITVREELAISAITAQCNKMGIHNVYPQAVLTLMNEIERYNGDFSKKFHELNTYGLIEKNKDKIAEVRALLYDDKSRIVYDAIVEKTKYNIDDYTDISDDVYEHYFQDGFFQYSNQEVFIDGGAFLGEDTIRLARLIGKGNIKRSYCFEPDISNYTKCTQNLRTFFSQDSIEDFGEYSKGNQFTVYKSGMFDKNENIGFISYGTHGSVFASLRNIDTQSTVPAVRLDDVVDKSDKVTLIKMDIEGAEIPALQGAQRIIKEDKPKLAICIYHMIEDLWQIPLYIHQLVPEYKLFVRHHTTKFWDSVVYATL